MNENNWTKSICNILKSQKLGDNIYVDVLRKIPYAIDIISLTADWEIKEKNNLSFETDLIVYEKIEEKIIPRVVIESKVESVSTHDAITYSQKAFDYKYIIPYLRYGIMLGNRKNYPLPGRLFRHGVNFDFYFSFVGVKPTNNEVKDLVDMIRREIKYSKQLEEILKDNRKKDRKRYYMLQKKFYLK